MIEKKVGVIASAVLLLLFTGCSHQVQQDVPTTMDVASSGGEMHYTCPVIDDGTFDCTPEYLIGWLNNATDSISEMENYKIGEYYTQDITVLPSDDIKLATYITECDGEATGMRLAWDVFDSETTYAAGYYMGVFLQNFEETEGTRMSSELDTTVKASATTGELLKLTFQNLETTAILTVQVATD